MFYRQYDGGFHQNKSRALCVSGPEWRQPDHQSAAWLFGTGIQSALADRPFFQAFRPRRQRHPMAAWAMPGITFHPRHDGLDRRDLDFVMAAVQLVVGVLQFRRAMTAAFGLGNDRFVRIMRQTAPARFAPEASWP
jgi:hypothetical protein